jgi:hypothetical protein
MRLVTASVVCLALLAPSLSDAQGISSFRSLNFGDHYIRHRLFLGHLDRIVARDTLGRKDASFRIVAGLANPQCRSFESVNYPNHFLRHQGFRLKLAPRAEDQLFKDDATFCFRMGLADSSGRSFESVNFRGHYIRHFNFELWLAKLENTRQFREDATFYVERPLSEYEPPVRID